MAAIVPFLEVKPQERPESEAEALRVFAEADNSGAGLGGLGEAGPKKVKLDADGRPLTVLQRPHTELTRLLWARKLMTEALDKRNFFLEVVDGYMYVRVDPPLEKDVVPWHLAGGDGPARFKLFSTNSKMQCSTFDLPAGAPQMAGSCPGATAAQSVVDPATRAAFARELVQIGNDHKKWRLPPEVKLDHAVCEYCYALGGKYGEVTVQFGELVRYGMIRRMLTRNASDLVRLLTYTLTQTKLEAPAAELDMAKYGKKFVRVHSSGDFFNKEYAKVWLETARQVQAIDPTFMFWAPTRTHVVGWGAEFWPQAKRDGLIPSNFSIRPSAYHVGDRAPMVEGLAAGSSVLDEDTSIATKGDYYDHQCGVYDLKKGNKRCDEALDPDGDPGCRACWVHAGKRVNYVIH